MLIQKIYDWLFGEGSYDFLYGDYGETYLDVVTEAELEEAEYRNILAEAISLKQRYSRNIANSGDTTELAL